MHKMYPQQVVDLCLERNGEWVEFSADVLPVKADAQETQTLVPFDLAKDTSEIGRSFGWQGRKSKNQ